MAWLLIWPPTNRVYVEKILYEGSASNTFQFLNKEQKLSNCRRCLDIYEDFLFPISKKLKIFHIFQAFDINSVSGSSTPSVFILSVLFLINTIHIINSILIECTNTKVMLFFTQSSHLRRWLPLKSSADITFKTFWVEDSTFIRSTYQYIRVIFKFVELCWCLSKNPSNTSKGLSSNLISCCICLNSGT